jgi:predicted nucleotidyltransferase component of viral defense system
VDIELIHLLQKLQKNKAFDNYYLVGGTALALQIGHRISEDIDLFTNIDLDKNSIQTNLNLIKKKSFTIINESFAMFQTLVDEIKVDFVSFPYKPIEKVKCEDGIKYLGLKDISAMKLHAVSNRGTEAKDFIDIYYLLKEMSLKEMFENYMKKYMVDSVLHIKKSLIYFDDIKKSSWDSIKMVKDKVDSLKVKKTLETELALFENG